jgi:hypothetical protein
MFRIIMYAILGLAIAGLFSPLIPNITNATWGAMSVFGAVFGAGIGILLNRTLGVQSVWHPEGLVSYWEGRGVLPGRLRQPFYTWLRSKLNLPPRT